MTLNELPLTAAQRDTLHTHGLFLPAQLQGLLADPDTRAGLASLLGVAIASLAPLEAALRNGGFDPAQLPPAPTFVSGVPIAEDADEAFPPSEEE